MSATMSRRLQGKTFPLRRGQLRIGDFTRRYRPRLEWDVAMPSPFPLVKTLAFAACLALVTAGSLVAADIRLDGACEVRRGLAARLDPQQGQPGREVVGRVREVSVSHVLSR